MIISRTPFRISFFGGGTDFPEWFVENGGAVLTSTINKYCYITCRKLPPFFEYKYRIVWSKIELVQHINEIQHPSVREVLKFLNDKNFYEISHNADLPARSGLGSSSSFTVGLLNALHAIKGKISDSQSLAKDSIHVERNLNNESVGFQDQIIAAHGGFNKISFNRDQTYNIEPVILSKNRLQELQSNLLLFFTGFSRISSDIQKKHISNLSNNKSLLNSMHKMVDDALKILTSDQSIDDFGYLLNESWNLKKELSDSVTNDFINKVYLKGLKHGALGGKILGAGGGGFILLFAKPENHDAIKSSLADLIHVPIEFDNSGSRIVLYQPEGLE